ncbi:MAG: rhomboid family intramembrane serine protease [Chloroflexi bacterium]|nr:rhomboid family intramembrane serine protease [Chloroflexota bacterium]MCY4246458.1 rhomboid family intramembrane serine protease [Chloroflexota bacterium]
MSESQHDHPLYQQRSQQPQPATPRKAPPQPRGEGPLLTYLLVGLLVAIYLAGELLPELGAQLLVGGALIPAAVIDGGQVYRLFTAMFLHASPGHIFFNAYALYMFGSGMETLFGRARLLLIYLLGGLSGSLLSLALGGQGGSWSVGASGAVFALFTAQALHLHQHRALYVDVRGKLRHMLFIIGINLVIGFMPGSRIDNWGHIGGMLGGLLLAWRVAPRFPPIALPMRSLRDLARTDTNPLGLQAPFVALYCGGLIALSALVILVRAG